MNKCNKSVSEERFKHLEQKNPLLSFHLCQAEIAQPIDLAARCFSFDPEVEVAFIEGVWQDDKSVRDFLMCGGRVVFVEPDLAKIRAFLTHSDLIEHARVEITRGCEQEMIHLAWKMLYLKPQWIGELSGVQKWVDGVHMAASDRHQGEKIACNIQSNWLRSHELIDGRQLEGSYQRHAAIICGSGPSLDQKALEKIRKYEGYALIIAAGSAVGKLQRAGIRIDFAAAIDPDPITSGIRWEGSRNFSLFYQNRLGEEWFSLHRGPKIWMGLSEGWQLDQELARCAGIDLWHFEAGWNAGTFALHIAQFLGCQSIAMVGLDHNVEETRQRDLVCGRDWIEAFVAHHQKLKFVMPRIAHSIAGIEHTDEWDQKLSHHPLPSPQFSATEWDFARVARTVAALHEDELPTALETFFSALKEGVDHIGFAREKVLLEVAIGESKIAQWVLEPMWEVTYPLFEREEKVTCSSELMRLVAKATFFAQTLKQLRDEETFLLKGLSQGICYRGRLEGEVVRSYPSGSVCAVEYYHREKRHGCWRRYFPDGRMKSEVHYRDGVLHGSFVLWGEHGIKRKGMYWWGLRDEQHTLFSRTGHLLCEQRYERGCPVGEHRTYRSDGSLQERLIYLTPKKFHRYLYGEKGNLTYRGEFQKECFIEEIFDDGGNVINERKGRWEKEALVWD